MNSTHTDEWAKEEIQKAFPSVDGLERAFFHERSGQIRDRPVVTIPVVSPDRSGQSNSVLLQ